MTYKEVTDYLFASIPSFQQIGNGAYKPGLERIEQFCNALGNPQKTYLVIHVAGTNGKGSVSHTIASVLQAAGYHTGLFTSPHLKDFRERIKVDGQMIGEQDVVRFVEHNKTEMEQLELSFFEMSAALAFKYFEECGVEVAVIETGLGGRLDATNIVRPVLSIITNIGLEHTALLGDTIAKIAGEKAGIIKPHTPVVIGESDDESSPVFEAKAAAEEAPICFADRCFECTDQHPTGSGRSMYTLRSTENGSERQLEMDLQGFCQRKNIVTVYTAISILQRYSPLSISNRALRDGCRDAAFSTGLMGRWQTLDYKPFTVCDTGHNAHGLKDVVEQISRQKYNRLFMVVGFVSDKDLTKIIPLMPREATYIFTQSSVARALPVSQLKSKFEEYGITGTAVAGVKNAIAAARAMASADDMIFVGGSTFTVADAL